MDRLRQGDNTVVTATSDISAQLLERQERHRRNFQGASSSSTLHDESDNSDDVVFLSHYPGIGIPCTEYSMNDEEYARRLALEEEDAALAEAIRRSEEAAQNDIVVLNEFDFDAETASTNHASIADSSRWSDITASSSNESTASNAAMSMDLFQHREADSGFTATFNIMERIDRTLRGESSVKKFCPAADCYHFASVAEDLGNWSCGYRNAQLLISSFPSSSVLMRQLHQKLQGAYIPSILCLQNLIKKSWDDGWDPLGPKEHRYGIVGSKNWIGPVDLYSMFMYLGIECKIVSFVRRDKNEGPHPELFGWCARYFSGSPNKLPLYLQHAGHSRSIVGWEEKNDGRQFLLVGDPGTRKEVIRWRGDNSQWLDRNFRKPLALLKHEFYEMMYLTGRVLSSTEQARALAESKAGVRGERVLS